MDQNITPLYIQDNTSVILPDGRRVRSTGEIQYPDGYMNYLGGMVPPADGSHGTSPVPSQPTFEVVSIPMEPSSQEPNVDFDVTNDYINRIFTACDEPSQPPFTEPPNQEASTTEGSSSQEPKQQAEPSSPAEPKTTPERPRDSANVATPLNLDPKTGYYRAFVRFEDRKKVSEAKLRQHLETFGPLGLSISPSPSERKNHSAFVDFKTSLGFELAKAAGRHALGDVQVWVMEREPPKKLVNRRTSTNAGARSGSSASPSPAPGFADHGRVTSQGLRPSQITPITTSGAANTLVSSPTASPGAPSSLLFEYTAGTKTVSAAYPSTQFGSGGLDRDRAASVRDEARPGARRPSNPITDEERDHKIRQIGQLRGVSNPQPLSPLSPNFDHDMQQPTATATTVPGPLDQSEVGRYTSHVNTTGHLVPASAITENLSAYQQAYPEQTGLAPSAAGFFSSYGGETQQQYTQTAKTSSNSGASNANLTQQQPSFNDNSSSSGQQQQLPRPVINGLENDRDAFEDECPICGPNGCFCGDRFPDCQWPYECDCPRPGCDPPPTPPASPPARTETPLMSSEAPGSFFTIPNKGKGKGISIMTQDGEVKQFKRDDWRGGRKDEGGEGGSGGMAA